MGEGYLFMLIGKKEGQLKNRKADNNNDNSEYFNTDEPSVYQRGPVKKLYAGKLQSRGLSLTVSVMIYN